jgi:hypothetical protein
MKRKSPPFPPLTAEQRKALEAFVRQHQLSREHQLSWVDALTAAWMRGGGYPTYPVDYSGTLHSLRNTHGTAWLQFYLNEAKHLRTA